MRFWITLLFLTLTQITFAQCPITTSSSIVASNDTTIPCGSSCVTLSVLSSSTTLRSTGTYSVSSIPYAPNPYTGTVLPALTDDIFSSPIPMGFPFCFFGNLYTSCLIGSNANISFNLALAGAYDPWPISGPLPGANCNATYNAVMGSWQDYLPTISGSTIRYQMLGTAPCRRFVVTFDNVAYFSCTSTRGTQQMVLYESTNIVEVHTQSKPICATWNSGRATTGIENPTPGAIWYTAPGQNGVAFTATNEAWRFTPTGIPTWTYTWYSSLSPLTPIGTGLTANVCPTVNTTYYVKGVATSNCDSIIVWDSVRVNAAPIISAQTKVDPSVCGKCDGSIKLFGIIAPGSTVSINYNFNSAPVTATAVVAPDSSVTLTGLCAGSYSQFFISSGQCGAPMTLINPPVAAAFTVTTMLGCNGDSVIISNGSTPPGYYSYWNYGDGVTDSSITNPLHIYTTAPSYTGTYTITLNYNTTNNHNPACNATATQVVNFNHPIASVFTRTPDTMCIGTPVVLSNASYGNGATYLWDFGNGITDTAFIPAPYTYPVSGVYSISLTVTDTIGCVQKSSATVFIISIDVATSFIDTNVCLLDSMSIHSSIRMPAEITSVNYSWLPPDNLGDPTSPTPKFFGVGDFVYSLVATTPAPYFCADTAVATIHSYPPITLFNLTPSPQTIPLGGSIQLNANGAVYYTWAPNNGTLNNNNINNPIATPVDSVTIYTVYGMNAYGCPDTAEIIVYVDVDSHEFIPTGFTPNGDGKNDIFRLVRLKYQKLVDFSVFNRWGERVFQTANIEEGWDGKFNGVPQDMGVYFYVATVAKPDGTQKVYKGDVTLIR